MSVFACGTAFIHTMKPSFDFTLYRDFDAKVVIFAPLLLVLLFTYSTTQYRFTRSSKPEGTEPPQVPYLVPFLGNTYAYASDPAKFFGAIT